MTSHLFNNKYKNLFVIITAALNIIYCLYGFITDFPIASVVKEYSARTISSLSTAFSFMLILVGFILVVVKIYDAAKILIAVAFLFQITPIVANIFILEIPRILIYSFANQTEQFVSYIIPSGIITLVQFAGLILLTIGFFKNQNNTVILRVGSIFLIILYLYAFLDICIKKTYIYDLSFNARYLLFYISILLLTFNKERNTETVE